MCLEVAWALRLQKCGAILISISSINREWSSGAWLLEAVSICAAQWNIETRFPKRWLEKVYTKHFPHSGFIYNWHQSHSIEYSWSGKTVTQSAFTPRLKKIQQSKVQLRSFLRQASKALSLSFWTNILALNGRPPPAENIMSPVSNWTIVLLSTSSAHWRVQTTDPWYGREW